MVGDPETLRAWALAWDGDAGSADQFRDGLLADPETFVLVGRSGDGRVVAGAVVGRSEHVVGVSNVFGRDGGPGAAWPVVLHALDRLFPTLPVVGYESGEDLETAVRHGFEPLGPLRVWLHGG